MENDFNENIAIQQSRKYSNKREKWNKDNFILLYTKDKRDNRKIMIIKIQQYRRKLIKTT